MNNEDQQRIHADMDKIDEMDGEVTWTKNSWGSDVAMHQGFE